MVLRAVFIVVERSRRERLVLYILIIVHYSRLVARCQRIRPQSQLVVAVCRCRGIAASLRPVGTEYVVRLFADEALAVAEELGKALPAAW